MGTRSLAQVAPTSATIALNAYIFGYGGHSLVTPHVALKRLWWTEERIKHRVTRNFVVSKLRGVERQFLDKPTAFGEGLTNDTYMEWILERAKRLFLILVEIGMPDEIFGCIDDSWADDDLPISLENVPSLQLATENDDIVNRKFYDAQFLYILRELQPGSHIDYGPREHIPMEYVNTIPPAVSLQVWDRVHFPNKTEEVFMRRKYSLGEKDAKRNPNHNFMKDLRSAQKLAHEHICPIWASYASENSAYILSDFVGEHTLGTFIDHRLPAQFQRVPTLQRPELLLEWMLCLSDALASLHHRGVPHTAIRPSNIIINRSNRIAFADVGSLRTFQRGKRINKIEMYDYAAPESQLPSPSAMNSMPPVSSAGAFNKLRKLSSSTSSLSGTSSNRSSIRSNSQVADCTPTATPTSLDRSDTTPATTIALPSPGSLRTLSRHLSRQISFSKNPSPTTPTTPRRIFPKPTPIDPQTLTDLPHHTPQMSDIYSFACILLDILTFLVKGKTNEFVKFRTSRTSTTTTSATTKTNSNLDNTAARTTPQTHKIRRISRPDSCFHNNADKLDAWMTILKAESERRSEVVFSKGVPELLRLVREMLVQNAVLRPTALEVRERIEGVLVKVCGMEGLCCGGRVWGKEGGGGGAEGRVRKGEMGEWEFRDDVVDEEAVRLGDHIGQCPPTASNYANERNAILTAGGQIHTPMRTKEDLNAAGMESSPITAQSPAENSPLPAGVEGRTLTRMTSWKRAFSRNA